MNEMQLVLEKFLLADLFPQEAFRQMRWAHYKRNMWLFREGETAKQFLILVEGNAKVFLTTANGKSLLLAFNGPGSMMGDVELFSGKTATSSIQAVTDVLCISMEMSWLKKNLIRDPAFLQSVCKALAEKLDRCSRNSSINLLYPLESRLARYILEMCRPIAGRNMCLFHENLVNTADLLGTSYRHLLRTLQAFVRDGYLVKTDHAYLLSDPQALQHLAVDVYQ